VPGRFSGALSLGLPELVGLPGLLSAPVPGKFSGFVCSLSEDAGTVGAGGDAGAGGGGGAVTTEVAGEADAAGLSSIFGCSLVSFSEVGAGGNCSTKTSAGWK
jgi:hypothetical protein